MGKYKTLEESGLSESELRDSLESVLERISDNGKNYGLKKRKAMLDGLFYGFVPTEENMDAFHEAMKKEFNNGQLR